jgi:quercetin dioxygenase-like cupin family protein
MVVEQKKIKHEWGQENVWADTTSYRGSFMSIKNGRSIFDHSKVSREETVYVLYGTLVIELNGNRQEVRKGQSFHLDKGIKRTYHAIYDDVDIVVISN